MPKREKYTKIAKVIIKSILTLTFIGIFTSMIFSQECFSCADAPTGTIFCDDFESTAPLSTRYFEYGNDNGNFIPLDGVGRDSSRGMRGIWQPGQVSAGGFKKSFGRTPDNYIGKYAVNPEQDFQEIYWRIDLRTQPGWQGGGADKLTRAMTLANSNWAQGMIAHIWSSGANNEYLAMDPASGIDVAGNLVSTVYNDFANLRWLGLRVGNIDLFSTENSGKWYCMEAHAKINTPGNNDGIFEFWVNDTLQAGSYNLNWHGNWNSNPQNFYINAIFVNNYWNNGSPVLQERYFDNFVISTNRIECKCSATSDAVEIAEPTNFVQLFPNPVNNYLNIKVDRAIAVDGYILEIFDTKGQTVLKTDIIKALIYTQDLKSCLPGNYYYKLTSNLRQLKTGKLVVPKIN